MHVKLNGKIIILPSEDIFCWWNEFSSCILKQNLKLQCIGDFVAGHISIIHKFVLIGYVMV